MSGLSSRWKSIGVIAILATMLLAVPLASAAPPPPPTPPAGSHAWAYGNSWAWNCANIGCVGQNSTMYNNFTNGLSINIHLYLGINVIYIEQNTSAGTSVEVYSSVVGAAYVSMSGTCTSASCNGMTVNANATARGYLVAIGYANVTTGTVLSNGANVAAIALQDAASNEQANFTGTYSVSVSGGTTGSGMSMNAYAAEQAAENSQVSFTPALGLFPTAPTANQTWTSNSSYTASGAASAANHFYITVPQAYAQSMGNATAGGCPSGWTLSGPNCDLVGGQSVSATVSNSGGLSLWGTDLGSITMTPPGGAPVTADILEIETTGSFGFTQGCIIAPSSSSGNLTGPGGIPLARTAQPLGTFPQLTATSTETAVYHPSATSTAHPGIGILSASQGAMPGMGTNSQYPTPETVQTATTQSVNNYNMVTSNPAAPNSGMSLILIVVVAAVAVVAVVGVVVWSGRRRRRTPAMATPPATPGQMTSPSPGTTPTAQQPGTPVAPASPPQPPRGW